MRVRSFDAVTIQTSLLLVSALLAACSGEDSDLVAPMAGGGAGQSSGGQTTGGQTSGGQANGGQAQGGGGAGGSAGATGGSGGVEAAGPRGRIQLVSLYGRQFNRLSASFSRPAELPASTAPTAACTALSFGACSLNTCEPATGAAPQAPVTADPHAGTISFTSTDLADPTRVVTASAVPDALGNYADAELSSSLLGQEALHFSAEGAEVPAFSFDMESPLRLLLTNPELLVASDQATLTISSTLDTVLTWDRGVEGVTFFVQGTSPTQSLSCSFDSVAGTGTIPAELASQVVGMELLFTTFTSDLVQAGDYSVSVVAAYDVMTPDRSAAVAGVVQ